MNHRSSEISLESIVAMKKEFLFPCVYHFYKRPPIIVSARDVWMTDQDGKEYLDCYSGVTVTSAGHCHPKIAGAIAAQAARLDHTTTIYLTDLMYRLAEQLAQIAPGSIKRSFFCASGTEANETALLLATLATGKQGIIALSGALHGRTKWAMSATGLDMWRTDPDLLSSVYFAPQPDCARCGFSRHPKTCQMPCADAVEEIIQNTGADTLAALIAEPIQGNGGIVTPPPGYWQRIRSLCDQYGLLLIFDEVQTAMNRTGHWFAGSHWETTPDIVTMAKALGNGMPIAVTMTTDILAGAYVKPGASTFGANPMSCAAALATLQVHREEGLGERSLEMGMLLMEHLVAADQDSPFLSNPRGKGLMLGIDVITECGNPDPVRCDLYLETLKDKGFLAGKTGIHRNVLTFMPPLTIQREQINSIGEAIGDLARSEQ